MIEKLGRVAFPRRLSLKLAMLYAAVVGLMLAVLVFLGCKFGVTAAFDAVYLSDSGRQSREEKYFDKLEVFIEENGITSENISAGLFLWQSQNNYVYVTSYTTDDKLLYDPTYICDHEGTRPGERCERCNEKYIPKCNHIDDDDDGLCDKCGLDNECKHKDKDEDGICDICHGLFTECEHRDKNDDDLCDMCGMEFEDGNEDAFGGGFAWVEKLTVEEIRERLEKQKSREGGSIVTLADGSQVLVLLGDYTEYIYYDIINVISLVVAMFVMILVVMLYFGRITKRIIKLSNEVTVVADGDMEHIISPDGEDEIGLLSNKVENMRTALLDRVAGEKAAMDANTELIIAMSHDIRTPLTVLLGYLDIMKMYATDDVMAEYVDASEKTALRLKKLSDDLFNYFLVFGSETKVDVQEYDAATLIDQLIAEHILLIREKGYDVRFSSEGIEAGNDSIRIRTDAQSLMRVIENIFSNIYKYADKGAPVSISVTYDGCGITLSFANGICDSDRKVESNHIGLKTCKKIAQLLGASFETVSDGTSFKASLTMPTEPRTAEKAE